MKYIIFAIVSFLLLVDVMEIHAAVSSAGEGISEGGNIVGNGLLRKKRSCIRRGRVCDGKNNQCCSNFSCRCNLWGTDCRCVRAGLFQR
uniref:U27-Liphistoxin-Lsp1d_1 n=1 Tax=Liphistius sp. SGP-2016 TaxID=1905180 RepID=A0A4Q8K3N9_9ARAC